jgi:hypothetical protein
VNGTLLFVAKAAASSFDSVNSSLTTGGSAVSSYLDRTSISLAIELSAVIIWVSIYLENPHVRVANNSRLVLLGARRITVASGTWLEAVAWINAYFICTLGEH